MSTQLSRDPSEHGELAFGPGVLYPPGAERTAEAWREQLQRWRGRERERVAHDGRLYERPEFAWTQSAFNCAVLMLWDETFYDRAAGRFRVEEYVRRGVDEFGGYDAVVLWHAYPLIGLDERNQYDFYRRFPGGFAGLRNVVARFQALGVRVFLDYNPWDTGTRRESVGDDEALAELLAATGADGLFLDTMKEGSSLRAAIDARRSGIGLESEIYLPTEHVRDHHLSWAQNFDIAGEAPAVLRNKWFEQRHMHHLISRWSETHVDELHTAFMNGVGVMVWENVFGTYRPWSEFDKLLLRAIVPVQRACAMVFATGVWTPLVPTRVEGVYASSFERGDLTIWTIVNRRDRFVDGPVVEFRAPDGAVAADLIARRPLTLAAADGRPPTLALAPYGVAAIAVAKSGTWPRELADLLAEAPLHTAVSLSQAARSAPRPALHRATAPTAIVDFDRMPPGMAVFPDAEAKLRVVFRQRECGTYDPPPTPGARFQTMHQPIESTRSMSSHSFAVDALPVSNESFAEFLAVTSYQPADPAGFLPGWRDGRPAPGMETAPVVGITIEEARAYARWAGKRLPTEDELQVALASRLAGYRAARVWELTESEHSDGINRFCILKGGSDFTARGSDWYVDGGPRDPEFSLKLLLGWDGLNRYTTVGFRCAVDLHRED